MRIGREDFEARQQELRRLYSALWPRLDRALFQIRDERNLSMPLLLSLTAHAYPEAAVRLLVVGQQTNGWKPDGEIVGDAVESLLNLYTGFDLGSRYVRSPFWAAAHELYGLLNPGGPRNGFLWTNLSKVDENYRRPSVDVENILRGCFDVLAKEIELAAPDIIVFFTGPSYDQLLCSTLQGSQLYDTPLNNRRLLARLGSNGGALPKRSYRTYHPKGLRLHKKWDIIREIAEMTSH
jgi:hypothetical protein